MARYTPVAFEMNTITLEPFSIIFLKLIIGCKGIFDFNRPIGEQARTKF